MKKSSFVGKKAAQTNYYADEQAKRIGLPINTRVTINFSLLGISPEVATTLFRDKTLHNRFTKWITRPRKGAGPKAPTTYHYGFENKRGEEVYNEIGPGLPHNVHVHWSMHIPFKRMHSFKVALRTWVNEIADSNDWPEEALLVEELSFGSPGRYLNKGARAPEAKRYGANPDKISEQGVIIGTRTGTSRNVGPTQRRADDAAHGINRQRNMFNSAPPPAVSAPLLGISIKV